MASVAQENKFCIMNKIKIIGISGVAKSGKDTLFSTLQKIGKEQRLYLKRYALADQLKKDLDPFLLEKFGISAFTTIPREKEIIRPMLVAYGRGKRIISKGTYWTTIVFNQIQKDLKSGDFIPVITDIRYSEFEKDELSWIKKNNGTLIHLTRYEEEDEWIECFGKIPDGKDVIRRNNEIYAKTGRKILNKIMPPNEDESRNDPILEESADILIQWKNMDENERINFIKNIIKNLNEFAESHGTTYKYLKIYNPWMLKRELNYPAKGHHYEIAIPKNEY